MSYINSFTQIIFGGTPGSPRVVSGDTTQRTPEVIVATTRRTFKGPQIGGHLSIHAIVDASTATSATGLTIWYSNLVNPDLTSDTDWVQDLTTTPVNVAPIIALTGAGKALVQLGNVFCEHVMLKADVTAGSLSLRVFARSEGALSR